MNNSAVDSEKEAKRLLFDDGLMENEVHQVISRTST